MATNTATTKRSGNFDDIHIQSMNKIPRLIPPSPPSTLRQEHFRRVFEKRNILFLGDTTIRSMYCDLIRALHNGKMLNMAEIKSHFKNHDKYPNEKILRLDNDKRNLKRMDCRRFHCDASQTTVYFIHLGTILDRKEDPITESSLKSWTESDRIDLIIVSCVYPDLCNRRLQTLSKNFYNVLPHMLRELPQMFATLNNTFNNQNKNWKPIFMWIPPIPTKGLSGDEQKTFLEIIHTCDEIAEQHHLKLLSYLTPWHEYIKEICQEESNKNRYSEGKNLFLKPEGARQLITDVTKYAAKNWKITW